MSQFKQGDIVRLKYSNLGIDLVVERYSSEEGLIWVHCLWKNNLDSIRRDKFLEEMLETYERGHVSFD